MKTKRYRDLKRGDHVRLPETDEFPAINCRVASLERGFLYVVWDDDGCGGEVWVENLDHEVEMLD